MKSFEIYKSYKWFYTSSGKLVVGGKSAEQNDALLKKLKNAKPVRDYVVMHTSSPGSPFCVLISDVKKISKSDLEECAIFTGCFSKSWKQKKKIVEVHFFKLSEIVKEKSMKTGTWGVAGRIGKIKVKLELMLVIQKKTLRAVPEKTVKKNEVLLHVIPGRVDKEKMAGKIIDVLKKKEVSVKKNDVLAALPAGGVKILEEKK